MHNPNQESAISGPINLLKHYTFESNGQSYEKVLDSWLERFPLSWVNLALVEALHQGRYKVVSVEQILTLWQRRGKPSYHFNHDFERLVSNNLPQTFDKGRARPSSKKMTGLPSNRRSPQINERQHPRLQSFPKPLPNSQNFGPQAQLTSFDSQFKQSEITSQSKRADTASSHPSEPGTKTSTMKSIQVTQDSDTESTIHSKMKAEIKPELVETEEPSEQLPMGIIAEESSNNDSNTSVSVPHTSSVGETLEPIHQFVPQSSSTEFHSKLTAMAQVNV